MHTALKRYAVPANDDSWIVTEHAQRLQRWVRRLTARTGLWDMEDDLWVAAALALVESHHRFDPSRGVPFEAFAEHRVRGAMLDELRRHDHLPRRLRARAEGVKRAREGLRQQLGREPSLEEVCERTQMDPESLAGVDAVADAPLSLEPEIQHADLHPTPLDVSERSEVKAQLAAAVDKLPDRLKMLLSLHYVEGLTYREIARIMDVSEPRVCQLHAQAISKVKTLVGSEP